MAISSAAAIADTAIVARRHRSALRLSITTLFGAASSRRRRISANRCAGGSVGSVSACSVASRSCHAAASAASAGSAAMRASNAVRSAASSVPSAYSAASSRSGLSALAIEAFLQGRERAAQDGLHGRHGARESLRQFLAAVSLMIGEQHHVAAVLGKAAEALAQAAVVGAVLCAGLGRGQRHVLERDRLRRDALVRLALQ